VLLPVDGGILSTLLRRSRSTGVYPGPNGLQPDVSVSVGSCIVPIVDVIEKVPSFRSRTNELRVGPPVPRIARPHPDLAFRGNMLPAMLTPKRVGRVILGRPSWLHQKGVGPDTLHDLSYLFRQDALIHNGNRDLVQTKGQRIVRVLVWHLESSSTRTRTFSPPTTTGTRSQWNPPSDLCSVASVAQRRIFIDTCIIREHNCAFSSGQLAAFAKTISGTETILILPEVTEREIERQLNEVADIENNKWTKLARSPHLRELGFGPFTDIRANLQERMQCNWQAFLSSFDQVQRLDYSGVDLGEVMQWYNEGLAPFGTGKKKHEFPDAFAIASLLGVADAQGPIEIVSKDGDMESACERWSSQLIHRPSLAEVAEILTREKSEALVEQVHGLLGSGESGLFYDTLSAYFPDLWFFIPDEVDGEVEDVAVSGVTHVEFEVMQLDEDDIVVAYSAQVAWSASVSFADPDSFFSDKEAPRGFVYMGTQGGTIEQSSVVEGTFGLSLNQEGTGYGVHDLGIKGQHINVDLQEGFFLESQD